MKAKKSAAKAAKVKQYLELIITVNSDLCTAVSAKERTNKEFFKLANQFSKVLFITSQPILVFNIISLISLDGYGLKVYRSQTLRSLS